MTFNSFDFIFLFFPITIIFFYTLSRYRQNVAVMWLIAASLFLRESESAFTALADSVSVREFLHKPSDFAL